jgi:sucrose-6-phosphate hydrolase SacC (GH32 family)
MGKRLSVDIWMKLTRIRFHPKRKKRVPMYPLLQHPTRYIWDFWYYYDSKSQIFHILYLNADLSLVQENHHHFSSCVGYATTQDFIHIDWIQDQVITASQDGWDNTSIWTGDVIKYRDGFACFYTSRDHREEDGLTQNLGLAISQDFLEWERILSFRIRPNSQWYESHTLEGNGTIHAWRDPFVFQYQGILYMILAAQSKQHPLMHKGAIGLLKSPNNSLLDWIACPPIYAPGRFTECEVPQMYQQNGRLILGYSSWEHSDKEPNQIHRGGFYIVKGQQKTDSDTILEFRESPEILLGQRMGLYACRIIPELNGDIVGFNIKQGGIQRISSQTNFQSVDRDFSQLDISSP